MTQPKRGLGRGLDALFGGPAVPPAAEPQPEPAAAEPETPPVAPEAKAEPAPAPAAPVLAPEPVAAAEPAWEPETEPEKPAFVPTPISEAKSAPPAAVAPPPVVETPAPAAVVAAPPPAPAPAPVVTRRGGPEYLDIDLISPNPQQPRSHFEPEKLRELSASIREHGVIQPLIVSRQDDGGYVLIAGERRLQASRLAGMDMVPVIIREASSTEMLELALIENIQRADLNPVEEAVAYRRLIEEYGLTQDDAAKRVGKSRAAVANALRLLQLESEIKRSLVAGDITEGHARALLGLPEGRGRVNAWNEVVKRKLSVRDTEGLVRKTLAGSPVTAHTPGAVTARRDANLSDIESKLRRALSTRVTVQPQKKGARIVIECYSEEEFRGVIDTILGDE